MVDPIRFLSTRAIAIAAFTFFAPVVVTFAASPGVFWADYPGILFHLAIFLLVPRLPAPIGLRRQAMGGSYSM